MGIFQDIKKSSFKEDDAIRIFRVLRICTLPDSYGYSVSVSVSSNDIFVSFFSLQLLDLRGPLN